jgi:hypothetical protein
MNIHHLDKLIAENTDCQSEGFEYTREHKMAMAVHEASSAMKRLVDLSLFSENRECMANEADFKTVCKIMTEAQLVASLIEVRMIANGEIEAEDAS